MNKEHWQDWLQAVLGLWVVVSPWILGATDSTAIWNFLIVGLVVIAFAGSELAVFQRWKEWLMAALGGWLLLSPRILDFTGEQAMTWNAVITGLLIVAFAGWAIGDVHEILPRFGRSKGDLRSGLQSVSLPDESAHLAGEAPHRPDTGPGIVHPGVDTQSPGQTSHE